MGFGQPLSIGQWQGRLRSTPARTALTALSDTSGSLGRPVRVESGLPPQTPEKRSRWPGSEEDEEAPKMLSGKRRRMEDDGHESEALVKIQAMQTISHSEKPFEPGPSAAEIRRDFCMARTWGDGLGAQCTKRPGQSGEFCGVHGRGVLAHGRVDGPVPPEKLAEMRRHAESRRDANGKAHSSRRGTMSLEEAFKTTALRSDRQRQAPNTSASNRRTTEQRCQVSGAPKMSASLTRRRAVAAKPLGKPIQFHTSVALGSADKATPVMIHVGDFLCIEDDHALKGGVGEVISLFDRVEGGTRMLWRRFRAPTELQGVARPGPEELHEKELVETDEVTELQADIWARPIAVLSKEAFFAHPAHLKDVNVSFCRRAVHGRGSGVLWGSNWDGPARDSRRKALVEATFGKSRSHSSGDSGPVGSTPALDADRKMPAAGSRQLLVRAAAAMRPGSARLIGREAELAEIGNFLQGAVCIGGQAQVMYVSGMPGTGKTASVLQALGQLEEARDAGDLPSFTSVHVNAMSLSQPGAVFAEICRKVPGLCEARGRGAQGEAKDTFLSESQAFVALADFFDGSAANGDFILLVIDEIDCLATQAQTVLYRLFEWLGRPDPRLAVVAISNTMDLPERLLPRVASRLGVLRVDFAPYGRPELRAILSERLRIGQAEGAFSEDALTLCAARVTASSGDARKALQVCRRAAEARLAKEAVQAEGGDVPSEAPAGPITAQELSLAEASLIRSNPTATAISGLSFLARRLLLAMVLELRHCPGASAMPMRAVQKRYETLMALDARLEGDDVSSQDCKQHAEDVLFSVRRLAAIALLRLGSADREGSSSSSSSVARLEFGESLDVDDVADALANHPDDELARELLGSASSP